MPEVIRFPSPESNDRIHLEWPLSRNEVKGIVLDGKGADRRIHFEAKDGGFLFEVIFINGRLLVDIIGKNPRELVRGEMMSFGGGPQINFPNQTKFFIEFKTTGEISVNLLNQGMHSRFMPDSIFVNELEMSKSWEQLSEVLRSSLELDNVGQEVNSVIELDPESEIRRLGLLSDEPFCVTNLGSFRWDKEWFNDLLSTNLIAASSLSEGVSYYENLVSSLKIPLFDGRFLSLKSRVGDPHLIVQIEGLGSETVHKDMLAEYLMRNV